MDTIDLIGLRRAAEQAVSDMPEGPYRLAAFRTILKSLLRKSLSTTTEPDAVAQLGPLSGDPASSFAARVAVLVDEGFFSEPRSLAEIQAALSERGWYYAPQNVSTPLVRLVRQRQLRRMQVNEGRRRLWKYSTP